jgi:dTDP-glucose pyrophosphorylase
MILMKIRKAVITSAGKATRMRPISNVIPKGLLPVFKTIDGKRYPTPAIDLTMDSLRSADVKQLCFVVGERGRMLVDYLFEKDVTFVFQSEPKGFGDAVLKAEEFVSSEPFFIHSDDDILTGGYKEAAAIFKDLNLDCLLFLSKVENPRMFGVVEVDGEEEHHSHKVYKITAVKEKPEHPKTNLAVCAVYIFSPKIFEKLKEIKTDGELQLTYGIEKLIEDGCKVYGMLLEEEKWLTIGNPEDYSHTLEYTYKNM